MNVASTGEFGISPFLLQAISSLSSPESQLDKAKDTPEHLVMEKPQQANNKGVTHLLQGMNEPVSALLPVPGSSPRNSNGDLLGRDRSLTGKSEEVMLNTDVQERLATQLAIKQGRIVLAPSSSLGSSQAPPVSDMSMVNVLTALASQHMKASVKQEEVAYSYSSVAAPTYTSTTASTTDMMLPPNSDSSSDRPQPQIIIYYNNESGAISSPSSNIVLGEMEGNTVPGTVQNYRVVLHHGNASNATVTSITEPSVESVVSEAAMASSILNDSAGTFVAADISDTDRESSDAVCPVCGDKISGYHYGVYTCESCKGFFKRTVQNKKSFVCHKQGDCEVMLQSRKKCPACRFAKCISVGMKLEAIRQDRTRGGRSSYNGSSPQVKHRPLPMPQKVKRTSLESNGADAKVGLGVIPVMPDLGMAVAEEEAKNHGQLAAILNHSTAHGQQVPETQGPPVPELLTDLMNLEAILVDDDITLEETGDVMTNEQAFYNNLMHLTEVRLYKLVRWARNLPQFGAISTDDQILLLQNCWSDLLALGVCWRSRGSTNTLSISTRQSISLEQAEALGFGDVTARLLSISQSLQRLRVDQFEYVALKVLLLISPDVKGLKEPSKIQEYQEKLAEALMEYTCTHYAQVHNKYGEMLLRLPELARISFLAKEILLVALPSSMKNCGLLLELLKGENAIKD